LHLTVSCVQSKQSLDDAIEYQSARLEVLSLLLAHGADPDEIYMPVCPRTNNFPMHLILQTFLSTSCSFDNFSLCFLTSLPLDKFPLHCVVPHGTLVHGQATSS